MSEVQTVMIFGATGSTGGAIIDALLESTKFKVLAVVRPASAAKPVVADLKAKGAEIVFINLESPKDQLLDALKGVDTLVSAILYTQLHLQYLLADAAREAGVKRFVPCDFGTPCVRGGVRQLHDEKAAIHDHIEKIGLGHTYIDVGWWFQNVIFGLPIIENTLELPQWIVDSTMSLFGDGNTPIAYTDLRDIGIFIARIIADPRTLNRYVFIWGEERTQREVFDIARAASGRDIQPVHITESYLKEQIATSELPYTLMWEYQYSLCIRGDNVIENAKKPEYGSALDARELYPDIEVKKLEDYARENYSGQHQENRQHVLAREYWGVS